MSKRQLSRSSSKALNIEYFTDESGFVVELYRGRWQRDPLLQCHLAERTYRQYLLDHSSDTRVRFLSQVRTLLTAIEGQGQGLALIHRHPVPGYEAHFSTGWKSCITQGAGIRVCCNAYEITKDKGFLEIARRLTLLFMIDISEGGVRSRLDCGDVFYEEFPFHGQCYQVLNGALSALLSVHGFATISEDPIPRRVFDNGVAALSVRFLKRYDAGYYARYDLRPHQRLTPSSVYYTPVSARHLDALYKLTGQQHFATFSQNWSFYSRRLASRSRSAVGVLAYRAYNLGRYIREFKVCGRGSSGDIQKLFD